MITEVGGTVGDIEGLPFLEAIRQLRYDVGRDNICYVHCALVPFIAAAGELKTKPAQHSVRELRSIGIQPDVRRPALRPRDRRGAAPQGRDAVRRRPRGRDRRRRPARACTRSRWRCATRGWTASWRAASACPTSRPTWPTGRSSSPRAQAARETVSVAIVGKYVDLPDAYLSVVEVPSPCRASSTASTSTSTGCPPTSSPRTTVEQRLGAADGVLVPGGFGIRGVEGKILAARHARVHEVPYLGLCLGLQAACIEFARNVVGLDDANSSEFEPSCHDPVIDLMPDQRDVTDKGGTMRLGAYPGQARAGHPDRAPPTGTNRSSTSATGTGSSSTTGTARLRGGRAGLLRTVARRPARRVHRARRPPVVRRDAGPPRAQVPPQPCPPALRRLRRRGLAAAPRGPGPSARRARRAHRGRARGRRRGRADA